MVLYATFNSISVISRRQLTLFMLSWVSPVLGWALKCLAQGHSHEKNPEDPVRLKHFTTEPHWTMSLIGKKTLRGKEKMLVYNKYLKLSYTPHFLLGFCANLGIYLQDPQIWKSRSIGKKSHA